MPAKGERAYSLVDERQRRKRRLRQGEKLNFWCRKARETRPLYVEAEPELIIVAYRNCGLSFKEIDERVGRNKVTVMRIGHRWRQEEMTDQWSRSHLPRCTNVRDDRWIVRMAVMDNLATSPTITQQIQSVTHHSVSAPTIRRHFQGSGMSTRFVYLWLETTGVCAANGAKNGGNGQQNETTLCLVTYPEYTCNITIVGFEFGDTVMRGC
ncbi:HTH_38 domain-containing protein [Trichonephila clavipes]|nr:HTH_38 domain-containing protein [Trichonephila clavipes]